MKTRNEGSERVRGKKEDEVGRVGDHGGESSGKAPDVGDRQMCEAASARIKGIVLQEVG